MVFAEAEQALRDIPGFAIPKQGERRAPGFAHYDSEMSISVEPDRNDRVRSIEVYRPSGGTDVVFRDTSVFEVPANELIRWLESITVVEIEDEGLRVVAPELLLSLWRATLPEGPDDEDGKYFNAVLVAAPGYYTGDSTESDQESSKSDSKDTPDDTLF